jgi:hypothetical protein
MQSCTIEHNLKVLMGLDFNSNTYPGAPTNSSTRKIREIKKAGYFSFVII